jgi:diguanylate cyclase (GGDEF)-like protein
MSIYQRKEIEMEIIAQTNPENYSLPNQVFKVISNSPILTLEHKLACVELLQERLELKDLMNNFAALVAKFVRPFNISFQSPNGFFSSKIDIKNNHRKNYNLSIPFSDSRLGAITYQSEFPITVNEDKLLNELHLLLVKNLNNSLKLSELQSMVFKDHLTNIGNRAYYEECLLRSIEQSSRGQQSLSLMLFDLNDFKIINDTLGHLTGDKVLIAFAHILNKSIRTSDIAFRLGGDEFAIILQPGGTQSIEAVNQRICDEISKNIFLTHLNFSHSMGSSDWEIGQCAENLFSEADKRLYNNKASIKTNR